MRRHATIVTILCLWAACGGPRSQSPQEPLPANDTPSAPEAEAEAVEPSSTELEIPAEPQPEPESVLATVTVGDPAGQLKSLGRVADAVQPGAGSMIGPPMLEMAISQVLSAAPAGLDYDKPLRALILDPSQVGGIVVIVGAVADADALTSSLRGSSAVAHVHEGYAAVGPRRAIDDVAPYALTTLIAKAPPPQPTLTVDVARIWSRYGQQLQMFASMAAAEAGRSDPSVGAQVQEAVSGLLGAVAQVETLQVSMGFDPDPNAQVTVQPAQGSALANIVAAQKPAAFPVTDALADASFLLAGRLDDALVPRQLGDWIVAGLGDDWGKGFEQVGAVLALWPKLAGAELAIGAGGESDKRVWLAGAWAVTDEAGARRMIRDLLKAIAANPPASGKHTLAPTTGALRHRGVVVDRLVARAAKGMSSEERKEFNSNWGKRGLPSLLAVADEQLAVSIGLGAADRMKRLIDGIKGKAKSVETPQRAAIDAARERGDSLLVTVDLAAMAALGGGQSVTAGEPISVGLGFADGQASIQVHVPTEQLRKTAAAGSMP